MEYFPTDEQEGFTFLVKFDKNDMATIAAKSGSTYKEASGIWNVIGDTGPVLTFDTYNEVFHIYSDPAAKGSDLLGIGWGGDYEFLISQISENLIQMKGKKRGTVILLRRLAENQNWLDYFTLLENIDMAVFNKNVSIPLNLTVGDAIYPLKNGSSHIFTTNLSTESGEEAGVDTKIPFIVTDYGIRFAEPFKIESQSVQTFQLSEDKNNLVCIDENASAKIEGPFPADFFFDVLNLNKNMVLADDMSPDVKTVYDKIVQSMSEKRRTLKMISISKSREWDTFLMVKANASGVDTDVYFSYSFNRESESEISLAFNGFNSQTDPNSKIFYDQFAGIDDLLNLLKGKFTVSIIGNTFAPDAIKLTSISNPSIWIVLNVK
jgi:hypothetical protein